MINPTGNARILLAAGIFYPDVGGPAIHVMKIAERLSKEGYDVHVLAYGEDPEDKKFPFKIVRVSRKWPKPLQWLGYFFYAFKEARGASVVYAFDPTAAGWPASLAAKVFRKPFFIRVGGDPIWERVVEKGKRFLSIEEYYKEGYQHIDAPKLFKLIQKTLKRADGIVVYNQFFKDFFIDHFGIDSGRIHIVRNPAFKREDASETLPSYPAVIFAGRFVAYKNLPLVMRAMGNVREKLGKGRLVLIGDGPDREALFKLRKELKMEAVVEFIDKLPQEALFERIKESALAIAPALSEFNPNFILEALSFGKPVIISRGNGLSVSLPEEFLFDPKDQVELERKMVYLFDAENYKKSVEKVKALPLSHSWDSVTDFHYKLVKEACQK